MSAFFWITFLIFFDSLSGMTGQLAASVSAQVAGITSAGSGTFSVHFVIADARFSNCLGIVVAAAASTPASSSSSLSTTHASSSVSTTASASASVHSGGANKVFILSLSISFSHC
jgi:hypothetical protein